MWVKAESCCGSRLKYYVGQGYNVLWVKVSNDCKTGIPGMCFEGYNGRAGGRTHPKVAVLQEEQFL